MFLLIINICVGIIIILTVKDITPFNFKKIPIVDLMRKRAKLSLIIGYLTIVLGFLNYFRNG
jgi:hypothetical protein